MNEYHRYAIISLATFLSGFAFFAVYYQWIIFSPPWQKNIIVSSSERIQKKQVILHYFHGDKWKIEKQEMLWKDNNEKNILNIFNAWMALRNEKDITAITTI